MPVELEQVNLAEHKTATGQDYMAVNPKGYVPALRLDDGSILTERPAIVQYLADQKPALIDQGHSVLFRPAYQLVQELLAAKRDLVLPQKSRRLDSFELLILDDIGYVKQNPEEAEVLFTLIAERYERRSMLITSNLVFSDWERIFKDPMATAAAIDRLVHHAAILEFNVPTYRTRKRRRTRRNRRKREREAGLIGRDATVTLEPRSGSRPSPSPLSRS